MTTLKQVFTSSPPAAQYRFTGDIWDWGPFMEKRAHLSHSVTGAPLIFKWEFFQWAFKKNVTILVWLLLRCIFPHLFKKNPEVTEMQDLPKQAFILVFIPLSSLQFAKFGTKNTWIKWWGSGKRWACHHHMNVDYFSKVTVKLFHHWTWCLDSQTISFFSFYFLILINSLLQILKSTFSIFFFKLLTLSPKLDSASSF